MMDKDNKRSSVRVKICGITSVADALLAVDAGADAIGLNFVGGPRQIAPDPASDILSALPPFITPVALIRLDKGQMSDEVLELLGQHWVSQLQVYGTVTGSILESLHQDGFRPMPAVAVGDEQFAGNIGRLWAGRLEAKPQAIVLDTFDPGRLGGTAQPFRWEWVPAARTAGHLADWPPIILAGGLTPDNVAEAVRVVQPYAVDVSSGVELAGQPGRKDGDKLIEFIRQAKGLPC